MKPKATNLKKKKKLEVLTAPALMISVALNRAVSR